MKGIPLLDELMGKWIPRECAAHYPSAHNFHGMLLCNRDLLSVSCLVSPPYTQGHHSGTLEIDGEVPDADAFRWYAYQALRRAQVGNVEVETAVRMVFEDEGVLFRVRLTNSGERTRSLDLKVDLGGIMTCHTGGWGWAYYQPGYGVPSAGRVEFRELFAEADRVRQELRPIPQTLDQWEAELQGEALLIRDKQTPTGVAFAFADRPARLEADGNQGHAYWKVTLQPGETRTIDYVMAFGEKDVLESATGWAKNFEVSFAEVKEKWQARFEQAFTPDNEHFSGHLPTLITEDEAVRRIYYMSVLTLLVLHRTNMPVSERVYLTGGPRLGATIMYYWDTSLWATVFALLDPEAMREHLKRWLTLDVDRYYAQDMCGGEGVGNMYSASRLAIFELLVAYLRVTGDNAYLDELAGEKSVGDHMRELATAWRERVSPGDVLADYGEAINLLECVPTYIHKVPSLNAANVWMMRRMADILAMQGKESDAQGLSEESDRVAQAVLRLYAPGEGCWYSLHRDGSRVEMRHCYDFFTVTNAMVEDFTPDMAREMVAFAERELLTRHWMRAQSLEDVAAAESDRPDHGPMGAYDSWPARTVDAMCRLGDFERAIDFFRRTAIVTYEGAYAQAHELYGANRRSYDAPVRIAERMWCNRECSGGGAFAETVIRTLFGYTPDLKGEWHLFAPQVARGFEGKLLHVRHRAELYTLMSGDEGLEWCKEDDGISPTSQA